jgi:hypothetical protein
MYSQNGTIIIETVTRFSPVTNGVEFVDLSQTRFHFNIKDLIRLYEGCKHNTEQRGLNWEDYRDRFFSPPNPSITDTV